VNGRAKIGKHVWVMLIRKFTEKETTIKKKKKTPSISEGV
jgi:hypothetical protein